MARYEIAIEYQGEQDRYKALVRPAWEPTSPWSASQDRLELVTLEATNDADAMAQILAMVNDRCGKDRRDVLGLARMGEACIRDNTEESTTMALPKAPKPLKTPKGLIETTTTPKEESTPMNGLSIVEPTAVEPTAVEPTP
jgi:hypothetical protein